MRSAGEYFRSWFGRFEAVAPPPLDPWLWLPAAALAVLGILMVLNTTYFLGPEKTGDAFHFFKLQLLPYRGRASGAGRCSRSFRCADCAAW